MAGISLATYKVEINWWKRIGVADASPLWTASSWATQAAGNGQATGAYVDVSDYLDLGRYPITISRGKDGLLGDVAPGLIHVTLTPDANKVFNPMNATSPLNNPTKYVLPMCGIKVSATFSTYYPLALGWTTRLRAIVSKRSLVEIDAQDLFRRLAEARAPTQMAVGTANTGAAVGQLLDKLAGGWPYRDLDPGIAFPSDLALYLGGSPSAGSGGSGISLGQPQKDYSSSLLAIIQNIIAPSLGMFFIANNGVATFRGRGLTNHGGVVQATVTNTLTQWTPEVSADGLINAATATRLQPNTPNFVPVPQVSLNQASIDRFGRQEWSLTSPYWKTDGDASSAANYVQTHFSNPFNRIRVVSLEGRDDTTLTAMLKCDVGDKVTIAEAELGTSADYVILGLRHTIGGTPFKHQTQWTVVPASGGPSSF